MLPLLKSGATVHYIVGNSIFYGHLVPAEDYLAQQMAAVGLCDIQCEPIRKRNSKKGLVEFHVSARREVCARARAPQAQHLHAAGKNTLFASATESGSARPVPRIKLTRHDADAHLLNCGLCLFDLGLQFLHNVTQAGGPGGGLCEYNQCVIALHHAGEFGCQLRG